MYGSGKSGTWVLARDFEISCRVLHDARTHEETWPVRGACSSGALVVASSECAQEQVPRAVGLWLGKANAAKTARAPAVAIPQQEGAACLLHHSHSLPGNSLASSHQAFLDVHCVSHAKKQDPLLYPGGINTSVVK